MKWYSDFRDYFKDLNFYGLELEIIKFLAENKGSVNSEKLFNKFNEEHDEERIEIAVNELKRANILSVETEGKVEADSVLRKAPTNLTKRFQYIIPELGDDYGETIPEDELVAYMDNSEVLAVLPKTETSKNVLEKHFPECRKSKDRTKELLNIVNNTDSSSGDKALPFYRMKFLGRVFDWIDELGCKYVRTGVRNNGPIYLETDLFAFILAPIIESGSGKVKIDYVPKIDLEEIEED